MTPHKHRDVIIAWANGAEIQRRSEGESDWVDSVNPVFSVRSEYRIKPKIVKRFGWVVLPQDPKDRDRLVTREIYPSATLAMDEWPFGDTIIRIEWEEEE